VDQLECCRRLDDAHSLGLSLPLESIALASDAENYGVTHKEGELVIEVSDCQGYFRALPTVLSLLVLHSWLWPWREGCNVTC